MFGEKPQNCFKLPAFNHQIIYFRNLKKTQTNLIKNLTNNIDNTMNHFHQLLKYLVVEILFWSLLDVLKEQMQTME